MHVSKGGDWRAQFHRIVAASNSNYVWELDPEQASFIDGRYGGHVLGLDTQKTAVRPRLQVYTLGELAPMSAGGSTSRAGIDFSLPVTETTSVLGAWHPDYSNVEIDQQSIAPTEFARRFSEVRPFFTQASANFNQEADLNAPMSTLYTPAIPAFRNGLGASGRQGIASFGVFNASGYGRDDNAYAFNVSDVGQRVTFSDQEIQSRDAVAGFRDVVDEQGVSYLNPHSHLTLFANAAAESGTGVASRADAQYQDIGGMYMTATTMVGAALQKMGPQFNPADGYANQPPGEPGIAGYTTYWSRQINFSPQAGIRSIAFSAGADRYHSPSGGVNQSDMTDQVRVDFKDLLSITAMQGISSLETCAPVTPLHCNESFLPYNGSGLSLGYATNTAHPSTISYMTGAYYHGSLSSWQRSSVIPLQKRLALMLEADNTIYASGVGAEPNSKQWLERAGLNYQFNGAISLDIGIRKIVGANQPYAFAPFGPASAFAPSACNGSFDVPMASTVGCIVDENVTNLSAALHFFRGNNELYLVYGDPNQLLTQPALYIKLIRYIGAGKGS